jgi:NAD(P)H-flavin reductase
MHTGRGIVSEVYLDGNAAARISCPPRLIPAPGQYLMADAPAIPYAPLPVPVFSAESAAGGFLTAPPFPRAWIPGTSLNLRGPLGRGFCLPPAARTVALVVLGESPHRLVALIEPALAQGAAITLICDVLPSGLPVEVEIMPVTSLAEIVRWADYIAIDIPRSEVQSLSELFQTSQISSHAQILLSAPMPCGGRGDCGVCAVNVKRGYKLICKEGPVFDLNIFL